MSQQNNQNSELQNIRHSAEHVLTLAMNRLYPNKFLPAMGPATDDGFYFDFDSIGDFKISENDFEAIEKEMAKIIKENLPIVKEEISLEQAKKILDGNFSCYIDGKEINKNDYFQEIKSAVTLKCVEKND
jgi:threonyl-tRNA synthetase